MRKSFILAVAMIIAYSSVAAPSAEAAGGRRFIVARNGGGFFANLMELERRKNAWLRATFLGR